MGKVFVTDLIAANDLSFIVYKLCLCNIKHTAILDIVKIPMIIEHIILLIFLEVLLIVLLGFGEILMTFFVVLLKCSLGGPYFTLFIRSDFISDDG